ncbi:YwiC-like family protein [Planctomycetes bacterium K23_9]|uniref:YwiC-like protein n=1 Tax=Stieleria marina TaxID=1930275 RepID=A0A517NR90_9BACT|nr:hypothetical protein K239x_15820 [Planctomycetes bacterium K23_9]
MPAQPATKLKPKEHGAYAILGIPMITSLVLAGTTLAGLCVAVASVAGFLAHEPLLVAIGHRGNRAQRSTPTARRRLGLLLAATLTCGVIAMTEGTTSVHWSLIGCGVLAAASFALAIAGNHRTLGRQLWGVIALSAPCMPILLAGDLSTSSTMEAWCDWLIGFAATTMTVRGVIAAQKRQSRMIHWIAVAGLSILVGYLTFRAFALPIATLPMLLMSWHLMHDPPHAKQLKRVGWTLVAGTIASAIWMTITL